MTTWKGKMPPIGWLTLSEQEVVTFLLALSSTQVEEDIRLEPLLGAIAIGILPASSAESVGEWQLQSAGNALFSATNGLNMHDIMR